MMSLDPAEDDGLPSDSISAPKAKRLYTLFLGDDAACFDASGLAAVHESRMRIGELVVHAAILDDAHLVRVLDLQGRARFVELFGFTGTEGNPTRRVQYNNKHGLDLESHAPGLVVRARVRSLLGRAGGWRGITHPGDRSHGLALVHCLSTEPCAPRTVLGVTVDGAHVRIDAVHEYAARGVINVIACATTLRITP